MSNEPANDNDTDLDGMSKPQLEAEVKKLRAAIRLDRDSTKHQLCWYRPELWDTLPEKTDPRPEVPPTSEFLSKCKEFRASCDRVAPIQKNQKPCAYCRGLGSSPVDGRCPSCNPFCDRCQKRWSTRTSVDCPDCAPTFPSVELRTKLSWDERRVLHSFKESIVGHARMLQLVTWDWMHTAPTEALIPSSFEPASTLHPPSPGVVDRHGPETD